MQPTTFSQSPNLGLEHVCCSRYGKLYRATKQNKHTYRAYQQKHWYTRMDCSCEPIFTWTNEHKPIGTRKRTRSGIATISQLSKLWDIIINYFAITPRVWILYAPHQANKSWWAHGFGICIPHHGTAHPPAHTTDCWHQHAAKVYIYTRLGYRTSSQRVHSEALTYIWSICVCHMNLATTWALH